MLYRVSYEYVASMCELFIKFSDGVPGGRRRASVPRLGPTSAGVLTMCVQIFKSFDHVKPPKKCPDSQKKKKKNPKENRALRLSGLGPNKHSRFNRVPRTIGARSLIMYCSLSL